jgi:hypothetical protein
MFDQQVDLQVDVLSFRPLVPAELAEPDGSIGLEAGVAFVAAVQRVLAAAAKASGPTRRPHYGQANRSLVRRYLGSARLAAGSSAGQGGFEVQVRSLLPGLDTEAEPSLLPPVGGDHPPLERIVNQRLLDALQALTAAAERHESSGDPDEFRHHIEAGVSADLCDAACGLLDAGGDVEVILDPAGGRPIGASLTTTSAKLQLRHRPAFEAAGRELRANRTEIEVRLSGRVTDLGRRSTADESGTVTLEVLDLDPPSRTVKVRVGPQRYDDAIGAHRANRAVAVRGTLVRQGNAHWIWSPVSFRIGPELDLSPEPGDEQLSLTDGATALDEGP